MKLSTLQSKDVAGGNHVRMAATLAQINALMTELMGHKVVIDLEILLATLAQTHSKTFVVLNQDEKIIGIGKVSLLWTLHGREARIDHFVVLPEYRGTDAAMLLVNAIEDFARMGNVFLTELICGRERPAARAFWKKHGFEEELGAVFRKYAE